LPRVCQPRAEGRQRKREAASDAAVCLAGRRVEAGPVATGQRDQAGQGKEVGPAGATCPTGEKVLGKKPSVSAAATADPEKSDRPHFFRHTFMSGICQARKALQMHLTNL